MIRRLKTVALAGVLAILAGPAFSAPITGTVTFGGIAEPDGGTDFLAADTVTFPIALVTFADGDFADAGIGTGDTATFNDITFRSATPIAPFTLWNVGGFSFEVDTITVLNEAFLPSNPTFLDLTGTGTISATGFEDTPGTWSVSTDSNAQGPVLAFSSTATGQPTTTVPVPATVLLFGAGLLTVLGMAARRRPAAG